MHSVHDVSENSDFLDVTLAHFYCEKVYMNTWFFWNDLAEKNSRSDKNMA